MKFITVLLNIALIGLIGAIGNFIIIQPGFKPLIGSYVPTYEEILAYGVISIAASCLIVAVNLSDFLENALRK